MPLSSNQEIADSVSFSAVADPLVRRAVKPVVRYSEPPKRKGTGKGALAKHISKAKPVRSVASSSKVPQPFLVLLRLRGGHGSVAFAASSTRTVPPDTPPVPPTPPTPPPFPPPPPHQLAATIATAIADHLPFQSPQAAAVSLICSPPSALR